MVCVHCGVEPNPLEELPEFAEAASEARRDALRAEWAEITAGHVASCVVAVFWRSLLGKRPGKRVDAQLSYTSLVTVRDVLEYCAPEHICWPRVLAALADPQRPVLDGRKAADVMPGDWKAFESALAKQADKLRDRPAVVFACLARNFLARWWPMPQYMADAARAALRPPPSWGAGTDELAEVLAHRPWELDLPTWTEVLAVMNADDARRRDVFTP